MKKLHGVHAPHRKNTARREPVRMPVPPQVILPMSMHIGAPAKPVVTVGQEVRVGQLIAEAGGFVSSPVYSGVSGKVKKIDVIQSSAGQNMQAVFIDTDGLQTVSEELAPVSVTTRQEFVEAVKNSGVVGLGGAGFPTAVKLTVKDGVKVDYLLVNGAECEPYITSDTRTMLDKTDLVVQGAELVQKYLEIPTVLFGIENNKPECIKAIEEKIRGKKGMSVAAMKAVYPQGGEKVLIYNLTGREVPEGKLPLDVGCIVMNCTSLSEIANYIATGMPLVEKCVTVDGSAVKEPQNVIVPIGTPMKDVIAFCGGYKEEPKKILYGGPMMGIAVPNDELPIMKTTNAVLAFGEKEAILPEPSTCIRCGRCAAHCPMRLTPLEIERAFELKKPELLEQFKVNLCMECGCCAFGCPAKRPLVHVMKLSKAMLREYQQKQKEAGK